MGSRYGHPMCGRDLYQGKWRSADFPCFCKYRSHKFTSQFIGNGSIRTHIFAYILLRVRAQDQHRQITCAVLFGYLLNTMQVLYLHRLCDFGILYNKVVVSLFEPHDPQRTLQRYCYFIEICKKKNKKVPNIDLLQV